jgi:hypothetical protein
VTIINCDHSCAKHLEESQNHSAREHNENIQDNSAHRNHACRQSSFPETRAGFDFTIIQTHGIVNPDPRKLGEILESTFDFHNYLPFDFLQQKKRNGIHSISH